MATIKRIEFGSDEISLFAEKGSFDLVFGSLGVVASAKTRREMFEKIEQIMDELHDIRWELDRDFGAFKGFDDPVEEPEQKDAE